MASKKGNGKAANLSIEILRQIRDEMRGMRSEQQATNSKLERLEKRQTEDSVRVASELGAVAHAVGEVRDLLRDQRADRATIAEHEKRLRALEKKTA